MWGAEGYLWCKKKKKKTGKEGKDISRWMEKGGSIVVISYLYTFSNIHRNQYWCCSSIYANITQLLPFSVSLLDISLLHTFTAMHTRMRARSSLLSRTNYFKWKKLSFGAPVSPSVWRAEITCLMEWNRCANWRNETHFFYQGATLN